MDCVPMDVDIRNTGFGYAMSLVSGKYKLVILYALSQYGVVRYNEMKRYISTISHKTLTQSLRELERDGLVTRTEYPQVPPKVEYSLSERGRSLVPVLDSLGLWGEACRKETHSKGESH